MIDSTLLTELAGILQRSGRVQPGLAITMESRLIEDLGIDSLDLVDVVLKIQDHFDIAIEDEDVPNLRRVSDLAMYISTHRGKAVA